jgi:hypothetical protein
MEENPVNVFLGALLTFTLLIPASFANANPQSGAQRTFLFASHAVREPISDEDSRINLTSFGHINATAMADRAACTLTHSVEIADTLGIYDKSSEDSFILKDDLDRNNSEYLADLLGLYLRQEFVLLFFDEPNGGDRRWVIETAQPWQTVVAKLRELKLTPITVRIKKAKTEVWFIDMGNKRAADMKLFTSDVNGQASATPGVAELLGNPDREMAVSEWRQKIHAFEQGSGQHLSVQLSSNIWISAAAVHTCSKEMSLP